MYFHENLFLKICSLKNSLGVMKSLGEEWTSSGYPIELDIIMRIAP